MKTTSSLAVLALTAVASTLAAQAPAAKPSTTSTAVHHTAAAPPATHAAGGCVKVPEYSSKITAAPATAACPKSMFTFTTRPNVNLDYVSPLVSPEVRESLGMDPQTFSLAYQELKVGTGELAKPKMYYTVEYTGWLPDGTQFDSSVGKPEHFTFPIGAHQVVAGWDLGLQGMHVGGKRRLFIPWQLGYGDRPHGNIPAKSTMIFDIELISQSEKAPEAPKPPTPPAAPAKPGSAAPAPNPTAVPKQ